MISKLSRCLPAILLACCTAALAQQAPPVRMGLWDSTHVTTMTGLQLPPGVAEKLKAMGRPVPGAEPTRVESQSCLTPEKWKEMLTRTNDQRSCTLTNLQQSSSGMSADITCTPSSSGRGSATAHGHMQMNFVSPEKVHGTVHTEVVRAENPQPIVMDMTVDSTWQGADCKGISPDTPKVIMK